MGNVSSGAASDVGSDRGVLPIVLCNEIVVARQLFCCQMERTVYEILIITLITILIIGVGFNRGFRPSEKCKFSSVSHRIPLWRRWRPSDPSRCDCCRAETQIPEPAPQQIVVQAWSLQRSKRGRKKTVDSSGHFCPNLNCQYHENRDAKPTPWLQMVATVVRGFDSGYIRRVGRMSVNGMTRLSLISRSIPSMLLARSRCSIEVAHKPMWRHITNTRHALYADGSNECQFNHCGSMTLFLQP